MMFSPHGAGIPHQLGTTPPISTGRGPKVLALHDLNWSESQISANFALGSITLNPEINRTRTLKRRQAAWVFGGTARGPLCLEMIIEGWGRRRGGEVREDTPEVGQVPQVCLGLWKSFVLTLCDLIHIWRGPLGLPVLSTDNRGQGGSREAGLKGIARQTLEARALGSRSDEDSNN